MSACSPEIQLYSGLHQKDCDQQIEGGDSALLLCFGETPRALLSLALQPTAEEGCGSVAASPEEDQEDEVFQ